MTTKFNSKLADEVLSSNYLTRDWLEIYGDEFEDQDELRDYLQDRIHECGVIYYHKAMKFLTEHDSSLHESMALASEFGYEAKDLNSELLATLLMQDMLSQELAELDFSECFEEVEEDED